MFKKYNHLSETCCRLFFYKYHLLNIKTEKMVITWEFGEVTSVMIKQNKGRECGRKVGKCFDHHNMEVTRICGTLGM